MINERVFGYLEIWNCMWSGRGGLPQLVFTTTAEAISQTVQKAPEKSMFKILFYDYLFLLKYTTAFRIFELGLRIMRYKFLLKK